MIDHSYSCQEVESRLEAAFDGELPADKAALLAEHLRTCPACLARDLELRSVRRALRAALEHYPAPPNLLARVRADIDAAAQNATHIAPIAKPFRRTGLGSNAFAYAASLIAVASLGWIASSETHSRVDTAATRSASSAGSGELASNSTSRERVSDDVRSAHFRSLLPGHLLDVVSTDQHTVKPWFAGKLDFAPRVANLDSAGFHLIGGRLDYVGGRHVVALVYGRRKHLVNLFLWPSTRDTDAQRTGSEQVIDGYTTRSWADGGMTYWAISDVQRADLDTLEQLYRSAAPGAKKPTP